MLNRRAFVCGIVVAALGAPARVHGQHASRVYRVGILLHDGGPPGLVEAFLAGLHDLGYVEGKNLVIERRDAAGKNDRLGAMAHELVRLEVDLVLALNTPAAQAASRATAALPIVRPRRPT